MLGSLEQVAHRLWSFPPWGYSALEMKCYWAACSSWACFEQELGLDDLHWHLPTLTAHQPREQAPAGGAMQKGRGVCPRSWRRTAGTGQTSSGSFLTDPYFQIHQKLRSWNSLHTRNTQMKLFFSFFLKKELTPVLYSQHWLQLVHQHSHSCLPLLPHCTDFRRHDGTKPW